VGTEMALSQALIPVLVNITFGDLRRCEMMIFTDLAKISGF